MIKIQNFLIVALTITAYCLLLAAPILAADSTVSASPSASLQTKLKELQAEIASKAAELKAEVSGKLQNKAYVGIIKSKADNSLVLAIREKDQTIKINEFTEFIFIPKIISKTKLSIKNLEVENYIVALGDVDETELLTAKRIFKIDPPTRVKQIYFGEVLAINENMITLKTDKNLAVSTSNQTVFKTSKGDENLSDIKIGQKIIVAGTEKNNIIRASLVYTFSSGSNIKVQTSSPSATPKKK